MNPPLVGIRRAWRPECCQTRRSNPGLKAKVRTVYPSPAVFLKKAGNSSFPCRLPSPPRPRTSARRWQVISNSLASALLVLKDGVWQRNLQCRGSVQRAANQHSRQNCSGSCSHQINPARHYGRCHIIIYQHMLNVAVQALDRQDSCSAGLWLGPAYLHGSSHWSSGRSREELRPISQPSRPPQPQWYPARAGLKY